VKEKLALHASYSKGDAGGELRFQWEPTSVARHQVWRKEMFSLFDSWIG